MNNNKKSIKRNDKKNKIIIILGQTATGKTGLAIELARQFKGEIVSADSRQVYRGMDIGTGKATKKEMRGIPHHLLDVVSPRTKFSVAGFQKKAYQAIDGIIKKEKTPFLVGGSAFYLYSVIDGWNFPKMKKNELLRRSLGRKPLEELLEILKRFDSERAKTVDQKNKRRVIRAIEIAKTLGKVPEITKNQRYNCLILGIKKNKEELKKLIYKRLLKRMRQGMAAEVNNLKKSGLSWKRLESFGLEYKWIARYSQGQIKKEQMLKWLERDIKNFSKKQMLWFKKDNRIKWIDGLGKAEKMIARFLNKTRNILV